MHSANVAAARTPANQRSSIRRWSRALTATRAPMNPAISTGVETMPDISWKFAKLIEPPRL